MTFTSKTSHETIGQIRAMCGRGMSGRQIARDLNMPSTTVAKIIRDAMMAIPKTRSPAKQKAAEDNLIILRTQLRVAMGIENSGIVRGFRAEFESALAAIDAIEARSTAGGAWRQSALYAHELASIREAVRWHAFQLQHVSAGELHAAATKLIAQTRSSGGELRICGAA